MRTLKEYAQIVNDRLQAIPPEVAEGVYVEGLSLIHI